MKPRFKFGLRTYILVTSIAGIGLAMTYAIAIKPGLQKRNVDKLLELGVASPDHLGVGARILVWYQSDLEWSESEQRFILALDDLGQFDQNSKRGDDYQGHPVAIEIYCDPDAEKLKACLEKLPTIRQVWVNELRNAKGDLVGKQSHRQLIDSYPNLIVASPRLWGVRLNDVKPE